MRNGWGGGRGGVTKEAESTGKEIRNENPARDVHPDRKVWYFLRPFSLDSLFELPFSTHIFSFLFLSLFFVLLLYPCQSHSRGGMSYRPRIKNRRNLWSTFGLCLTYRLSTAGGYRRTSGRNANEAWFRRGATKSETGTERTIGFAKSRRNFIERSVCSEHLSNESQLQWTEPLAFRRWTLVAVVKSTRGRNGFEEQRCEKIRQINDIWPNKIPRLLPNMLRLWQYMWNDMQRNRYFYYSSFSNMQFLQHAVFTKTINEISVKLQLYFY